MNRILTFVFTLISVICCKPNIENESIKVIDSLEITIVKKPKLIKLEITETDSIQEQFTLPIHGEISPESLYKYDPKITDTISDLRIIGSEKIDMKIENGILVSLLHNTGTFDEIIICTHSPTMKLIDHLYVGKGTTFDKGKSRSIKYIILNKNTIVFELIDWGYVEEEIEPLKIEKLEVKVNEKGIIESKKIILNNTQS